MRARRESFAQRSGLVRLQKFLSDAGVASRRHAEDYIREGRELVNGAVVDELPAFVDPAKDKVIFNGQLVRVEPPCYVMMHKPRGVVCSDRDPEGRRRAADLLPSGLPRLFTVGRLDTDGSGLLLLTNDGELAARITHPSFGLAKVYRAEVRGEARDNLPAVLKKGVYLAEGRASASDVVILDRSRERSALQITLREGRNRQVRRMLVRVGHPVRRLQRVAIGPLKLGDLALGQCRRLSHKEVLALQRATDEAAANPPPRPTRRRRPAGEVAAREAGSRPRAGADSHGRPARKRRIVS
jgi:23S rRNA pseudouridine2605 synthase